MKDIAQLLGQLEPFVRDYGALAITIILTFESMGAPLPGKSLLIFASALADRPDVISVRSAGGVDRRRSGRQYRLSIGRSVGRTVLLRYGQKIGLNDERLRKIEAVFARYGPLTVGFARFFSVLRQLNGVVAGTLKMDWWQFLFSTPPDARSGC